MSLRRFVWPAAIILLGAFLRFHRLEDYRPNIDHAYPIAQAIGLLQSGRWPALGQYTSILFANPPGMSYMVLLPTWLFGTIWGVHQFVVSLNLLVVPLVYQFMRRVGGEAWARAAALLAATSPWLVHYSRGTWVQSLLPFWATLTFVLLLGALLGPARRRSRALFVAMAALAGLTQMYLLAFLGAAQAGLVALIHWRRLAWRGMAAGLGVLALGAGLYAFHVAADWPAQSAKLESFASSAEPLQVRSTAFEHGLRFVTGRDYEMAWGKDDSRAWQVRRAASLATSLALTAVWAAGLVWSLGRVARRAPDSALWLSALAWWGLPVLAMTVSRQPVHVVYLVLTVPAGFVLAAPALARLMHRWRGVAVTGVLFLRSFLVLNGSNLQEASRPAGASLDTITPRAVVPFQRTAAALADRYRLTEFFAPLAPASLSVKAGRDLSTVTWFQLPEFEIFPLDRPAVYIRLASGEPPAPLALAEREATLQYPGGDFITFDVVPAFDRDRLLSRIQNRVDWPTDEGLTLLGYDRSSDGAELISYWVVDGLSESRGEWLYGPYLHLTDAGNEIVANVSVAGLPGYLYRWGDVYRYEMQIPDLPPGDYLLGLGLYDGLHGRGVTFQSPREGPRPFYLASISLP